MFDSLQKQRDEVHRRIGRFMLIFQDVERMLKFILIFGSLSAPISRLESIHKRKTAKYAVSPMGPVMDDFIKHLVNPESSSQLELNVISEVHVKTSLQIGFDDVAKQRFRESLERIRRVRNEIAHDVIEQIDLTSKAGCKKASTLLEERWDSVKPDIALLREIFLSCRAAIQQADQRGRAQ